MNNSSCSGSRAENSSALVRRFRSVYFGTTNPSWSPDFDYVEFNGEGLSNCELVHKSGKREAAYWSLSFATDQVRKGNQIELHVLKYKVGDRVRILSDSDDDIIGSSGTIVEAREYPTCYNYRVKHAKVSDELFRESDLEPLTWKKGDRVAINCYGARGEGIVQRDGLQDGTYVDVTRYGNIYSGYYLPNELELLPTAAPKVVEAKASPAAPKVRYFKRNENDTWYQNVSHVTCVENVCTWHNLNGSKNASSFGPGAFATNSSFTEVGSEPKLPPKTRWLVVRPECEVNKDFRFVEFVGDVGIYHYTNRTQPATLPWETLAKLSHYVEVFERPTIDPVFTPQYADKPIPVGYRALKKGEKRRPGRDKFWSECTGRFEDVTIYDTYGADDHRYNLSIRRTDAKSDEQLAETAHLAAEAAKPKVRWFVQKNVTNPLLAFVSFTDSKGLWHYNDGTTEGMSFNPQIYVADKNFMEVFEEPKIAEAVKPRVIDLDAAPWTRFASVESEFWTVTDANTECTNSRSKRFDSEEAALAEATERVNRGAPRYADGVYVMKATKLVKRS